MALAWLSVSTPKNSKPFARSHFGLHVWVGLANPSLGGHLWTAVSARKPDNAWGRKMKVLLADNSRTVRALVRQQLAGLGYSDVTETADGNDVLGKIALLQPDLLLVDPDLPGIDGITLITRIREVSTQLPILMFASPAEKRRTAEAVKAGVSDCIFKPTTAESLAEKIAAVLPKQAGSNPSAPDAAKPDQPRGQADSHSESPLKIAISNDRLRATLVLRGVASEAVTEENIRASIEKASVPVTEEVSTRISQLIEMMAAGRRPEGNQCVVAEGRPPKPGIPAGFKPAAAEDEAAAAHSEGPVDFRESRIPTVEAGETIGTYMAEVPPSPGVDVFGGPIPAPKGGNPVTLGKNTQLSKDGKTVFATVAGKLQMTRQEVSVVEVVEIKSDVDYSTGNVESKTDILISGTIREGFKVKSAKSISVRGAVEAAEVEAGTHVQVAGGIITQQKGRVVAQGEICAKFCEEARLEAGGDIVITRAAMNSVVRTGGRLVVSRGQVIGGKLFARQGAEIKQLGNIANARTEITVGQLEEEKGTPAAPPIEQMRETAAKIRSRLGPVMDKLNSLSPEQQEQVKRLLSQAERLDAAVADDEKRVAEGGQTRTAEGATESATLVVTGRMYPGVVITIGDKMTVIDKERAGPLKIQRRLVDRVQEIVLVDQLSGSVYTLPSRQIEKKAKSPAAKVSSPSQPAACLVGAQA